MSDSAVLRVWDRSHRAFYAAMTSGAPGGQVVDIAPGVTCAVVPTAPQRSLPNGVCVEDADAFAAALPAIRALYADAGVRAWTVWVGPGREALRAVCEAEGLAHDGAPPLMHAPIAALDLAAGVDCELVEDGPTAPLWAINDAAFGMSPDAGFVTAFGAEPDAALRRVVAIDGDQPVACVCWIASGGDAYIGLVGVVPEARGRALARGLMSHALRRAQAEGAVTTTLESSLLGYPVYAGMGYVDQGPCGLWESRSGHLRGASSPAS